MRLIDLWKAMIEKASEEEKAIARVFHPHIEDLDEALGEAESPQEYPKWVCGVVVDSSQEEARVLAAKQGVTAAAQAPVLSDEQANAVDETAAVSAEAKSLEVPAVAADSASKVDEAPAGQETNTPAKSQDEAVAGAEQ